MPTKHTETQPRAHPRDHFRLDGEVALITGGGTGLGLTMARRMNEAGAKVIIAGRREQVLREAAAECGGGVDYLVCDVTLRHESPRLLAQAAERAGDPVSILINNAGINHKSPAVTTSDEDFDRIMQTNVSGAFALTRAAVVPMMERGGGSVLFIASMASLFGIPGVVAYAAAKSAYLGMVRTLAVELSPHGVRINAIAPGWIDSAMLRKAFEGDPARRDRILSRTPMGTLGEPDDVAFAAVYLCAPAARFITGAVLPVDGGVSIGF